MSGEQDFLPRGRAAVQRVRRESGDADAAVIAYQDPGSGAQTFPGDSKFPFVKDPPDVERLVRLRRSYDPDTQQTSNPIPTTTVLADFEASSPIDTTGFRELRLILGYFPQAVTVAQLSLIPEARIFDSNVPQASAAVADNFAPIGVVEPCLFVTDTTTGDVSIADGYAFRRFYQTELRFNPFLNRDAPVAFTEPATLMLVFDVRTYRGFRFRFAELEGGVTSFLDLSYVLMR